MSPPNIVESVPDSREIVNTHHPTCRNCNNGVYLTGTFQRYK